MSEEKLSSEQVPPKFAEWLLAMGCPPENVPPIDKIAEMCRGQYYMVWRSLMEHVGPKDTILTKRLQVFNNDIAKSQKKNVFNEVDVNTPKELSLWYEHAEVKEQVASAEVDLAVQKDKLNQLMNKVSSKLAHRNLLKKRLQDAQRRSWLLQQVGAELRERKVNLQETKTIADSLCCLDESQDIECKVTKCLTALSRPVTSRVGVSLLSIASPVASSSIVSTTSDSDAEEHVTSLVKCRGDVVYKQLFERRAGLCSMAATHPDHSIADKDRKTPQSVLAHTAALHCSLALEAVKNRVHIKQTSKRLAATINELNNYLSGEACELLVLRCERAHSSARAKALRILCDELNSRDGIFAAAAGEHDAAAAKLIHSVDKSIVSKRDELKRLIVSTAAVERKTENVKENLMAAFNSFHASENERFEAASQTSITNIQTSQSLILMRQFYEERRERKKKKMELSMDLDVSEGCSYELTDNANPKYVDELKMYLKKFNLEKNRKLVLENGEKIWIFESVQSSLDRLYAKWQDDDVTTSIICPSVSLAHNLARLAQQVIMKNELEASLRLLEDGGKRHELTLDISPLCEEERKILDKVKKKLHENILSLQRTGKTLDIGMQILNQWSENYVKQFISDSRTVDGRHFKEYERDYLENLRI